MENQRLSTLLKLIAHPDRMNILFLLLEGDCNVSELCAATGQHAATVYNHLAKLRTEGLVGFTRYHRVIEYRLISDEAAVILHTLKKLKQAA
ncbi:ArsR/SmtB family transcription factor [Neisseria iguanae]|uniref:ArsR family transcriptional regulator n=1 Tax=Neisseria iguanae TaxID=90242 RepID=A0A2P7U0J1_9NEIS|nr:metalloregulator ArsR/SmtB family transcription factor [Neisseria iguanae]PSJ80500.1 ArsR family transcriptional regulator [Neisseria iguanae]